MKATDIIKRVTFFIFVLSVLCIESCNPSIHSFNVRPLTTICKDSVKVNWKVNGKATLLFHEVEQKNAGEVSAKYFEFILSVQKGANEVHRMVQVAILPDTSFTEIVFTTTLHGDTLVAEGNKNILRWGNAFKVVNILSNMEREIFVTHVNKTIRLQQGSNTLAFENTPVEGFWQLRSLLTQKEKSDISTAPDRLRIKLLIQFKKDTND